MHEAANKVHELRDRRVVQAAVEARGNDGVSCVCGGEGEGAGARDAGGGRCGEGEGEVDAVDCCGVEGGGEKGGGDEVGLRLAVRGREAGEETEERVEVEEMHGFEFWSWRWSWRWRGRIVVRIREYERENACRFLGYVPMVWLGRWGFGRIRRCRISHYFLVHSIVRWSAQKREIDSVKRRI